MHISICVFLVSKLPLRTTSYHYHRMAQYNILLVGQPNVGKTSFIKRLTAEEFVREYHPTNEVRASFDAIQVVATQYSPNTSIGKIHLNIFDCPGLSIPQDVQVDAVILMYSLLNFSRADTRIQLDDMRYFAYLLE